MNCTVFKTAESVAGRKAGRNGCPGQQLAARGKRQTRHHSQSDLGLLLEQLDAGETICSEGLKRLRLKNSSFESELENTVLGCICKQLRVGGGQAHLFLHIGSGE